MWVRNPMDKKYYYISATTDNLQWASAIILCFTNVLCANISWYKQLEIPLQC